MEWEYLIENINHFGTSGKAEKKIQDSCDEKGKEGWELVSCQCYDMSSKFMLVFKRPKK